MLWVSLQHARAAAAYALRGPDAATAAALGGAADLPADERREPQVPAQPRRAIRCVAVSSHRSRTLEEQLLPVADGSVGLAGLRSESHSEDGAPEEERYTRVWLRPSAEPPVLALSDLLPRRRAGVVRYATQSGKGAPRPLFSPRQSVARGDTHVFTRCSVAGRDGVALRTASPGSDRPAAEELPLAEAAEEWRGLARDFASLPTEPVAAGGLHVPEVTPEEEVGSLAHCLVASHWCACTCHSLTDCALRSEAAHAVAGTCGRSPACATSKSGSSCGCGARRSARPT